MSAKQGKETGKKVVVEENWELASPKVSGFKVVKRKRDPSPICGLKKGRMDEESLKAVIASSLREQTDRMQLMFDKAKEDIVQQVGDRIQPIEQQISVVSDRCDRQEKEISDLSKEVASLKDTIKEEVRNELRSEFKELGMQGYKAALALEIEKVSRNVVVQGLKDGGIDTITKINSLITDMQAQVSFRCEVKVAFAMGKGNNPPILVTLADPFQRNELLRNATKLPKGVYMDRDIPKPYRATYKKFQYVAWKKRTFLNVQTQIIFEGHLMQLRGREKDKGYVILDEFYPPPPSDGAQGSGGQASGGQAGTLPPSNSLLGSPSIEVKSTLVLQGVFGKSEVEVKKLLEKCISPGKMSGISKVSINKNTAMILCNTPELAVDISKSCNGKTIDDLKLRCDTY